MKSVLVRLSEYGERGAQMSAAEAGVVRFVREQPEEAADLSIHLLAQRTFSSPSTIVRMCHRLGFDGCGVHGPMCQPPSPHHHLNTQISMEGSYSKRR